MGNKHNISDHTGKVASDRLDRMLDAVLAKYASVEPRAGLEERILASFRGEDVQIAHGAWWMWGVAGALAIGMVVFGTLVWRTAVKTVPPPVVVHTPNPPPLPSPPNWSNRWAHNAPRRKLAPGTIVRPSPKQQEALASGPKLDVFPSPLPLSEQEKILAVYVGHYPEHAALLGEVRMDDLRREAEERRAIAAGERDQKQ